MYIIQNIQCPFFLKKIRKFFWWVSAIIHYFQWEFMPTHKTMALLIMKNFGYFAFWISQNIAFVGLWQQLQKLTPEINTFERLGVWVWDSKPEYQLQNSSGYSTAVPYPEHLWGYQYMYQDQAFNKCTGEPTVRQTDWTKLWLYLAVFQCQITKQSYKIIR